MNEKLSCPCCGYKTLDEIGEWEICSVCWWEDDGQDNQDADKVKGGPNGTLSLTQARINFINHGISSPSRKDLKPGSFKEYKRGRIFVLDGVGNLVEKAQDS